MSKWGKLFVKYIYIIRLYFTKSFAHFNILSFIFPFFILILKELILVLEFLLAKSIHNIPIQTKKNFSLWYATFIYFFQKHFWILKFLHNSQLQIWISFCLHKNYVQYNIRAMNCYELRYYNLKQCHLFFEDILFY